MAEMRAKFRLDLVGNVSRTAGAMRRDFRRMGDAGERDMARIKRSAERLGASVGMVAGRVAGIAAGFVGVQELRRVMSLEERLERLGVAAGKSTEEMQAFRVGVNDMATMDDINVDPSEIIAAVEAIQETLGDFDFADSIKRELGLAIQATGSAGREIGALVSSMSDKFGFETKDEILEALDLLARQGKAGAIELSDLASLGPKVFSAYARLGEGGLNGLAEAGALMQVFKGGVGDASSAATVFENIIGNLSDTARIKKLRAVGIAIKDTTGALKAPAEILKEVITKAGGDDIKLGSIFDTEAMRGVSQLSKEFRETGRFDRLDELKAITADGAQITADSARLAKTANAEITGALTELRDITEEAMAEPIQQLAAALREVDRETVDNWMNMAKYLGVAAVAIKAFPLAKGAVGALTSVARVGATAAGRVGPTAGPVSRLAGMAGSMAAPVPVFVTNKGFGGGSAGMGAGDGRRGASPRRGGPLPAAATTASGAAADLGDARKDFARKNAALRNAQADPTMRKHLKSLSADVRASGARLSAAQNTAKGFGISAPAKGLTGAGLVGGLMRFGGAAGTGYLAYSSMSPGFERDNAEVAARVERTGESKGEAFKAIKEDQAVRTNEAFESTLVGGGIVKGRDWLRDLMGLDAIDARGSPMRDAVMAAAAPAVASTAGGAGAAVGGPDPIAPPDREGGEGGISVGTVEVERLLNDLVGEMRDVGYETRNVSDGIETLTSEVRQSGPSRGERRRASRTGRVELLP